MTASSTGATTGLRPAPAAPERSYRVDARGLRIAVHEWGRPSDPPVLLCHGTMEFARSFDGFAPVLAARGYRVIAWDHRGHGDSDRAQMYSWTADLRDAALVADGVPGLSEPVLAVGHSKGGALMTALAAAWPSRLRAVVNVEGFQPIGRVATVDVATAAQWLDRRRHLDRPAPGRSRAELVERRARVNPRVEPGWLDYLAGIGTEPAAGGGLRWKIDPAIRLNAFWPRRPEWAPATVRSVVAPFLAVVAEVQEPVGRGATPADVAAQLPALGSMVVVPTGHFVHFEDPVGLAGAIDDFFAGQP